MRACVMLLCLFAALLVVGTYSETCEAKGKKGAVKKKSKKAKKVKAESGDDVSDNPYADDEGATEDEAAGDEPETAEADDEEAEGGEATAVEDQPSDTASLASQIKGDQGSVRRSGRMEFDERLVKGQAAKSGAVYLFKRVPRQLPGLVPMRRSYRKRIVEPVLGQRELKAAVYSEEPAPATEPESEAAAAAAKPAEEPAQPQKAEKTGEKGE